MKTRILLNSPMRVGSTYLGEILKDYFQMDWEFINEPTRANITESLDGGKLVKIHQSDKFKTFPGADICLTITRHPTFAVLSRVRFLVNRVMVEDKPAYPLETGFLDATRDIWEPKEKLDNRDAMAMVMRAPQVPRWYFRDLVLFGDADIRYNDLVRDPAGTLKPWCPDTERMTGIALKYDKGIKPDPEPDKDSGMEKINLITHKLIYG